MKPFPAGLDTLLATGTYVYADLYDFTLWDNSHVRYTTADTDVLYGGHTYTSKGPFFDTVSSKSTAHWKAGLDLDAWVVQIVPAPVDPITGASFPAQLFNQSWLAAVRAGALRGATVDIHRAYWAAWPGWPPPPLDDATTTAWVTAVVANGGTVSTARKSIINDLIVGLRSDGVLTQLDRLWILAAENEASALTDLVADALATTTGSPTFTANRGYEGTDAATATKYIDTGYNPSVSGVNYTLNAAHFSAWCVGNVAVAAGGVLVGTGTTSQASLHDTFTDGNIYARINEAGAGDSGAPATRAGHWVVDRTTNLLTTAYQNGASYATPNQASTALPTASFTVLCRHDGAAFASGNPNQAAMVSMGGHLTAAQVTSFYNRLRTYMTAVGVP